MYTYISYLLFSKYYKARFMFFFCQKHSFVLSSDLRYYFVRIGESGPNRPADEAGGLHGTR